MFHYKFPFWLFHSGSPGNSCEPMALVPALSCSPGNTIRALKALFQSPATPKVLSLICSPLFKSLSPCPLLFPHLLRPYLFLKISQILSSLFVQSDSTFARKHQCLTLLSTMVSGSTCSPVNDRIPFILCDWMKHYWNLKGTHLEPSSAFL